MSLSNSRGPSVCGHGPDLRGKLCGGRYRLEEVLGWGGSACVYAGLDVDLRRPVAVKVVHPEHARSEDQRRRVRQEARLVALVEHPHVTSILDFGVELRDDGEAFCFLVMPLVRGVTLRDLVLTGAIAWPRAVSLIRQLLAGLAAIHSAGALHRDLKAQNCLVGRRDGGEHLWILDFGLAKAVAPGLISQAPRSLTGVLVGTLPYLSPEQAQGLGVDARSDLYAVGVLLFELLTRRLPFVGTDYEVLTSIVERAPPPVCSLAPEAELPEQLEAVVSRALAKDPGQRYRTAAAFDAALVKVLEGDGADGHDWSHRHTPVHGGCDEARTSLAAWSCFEYKRAHRMAKRAAQLDHGWSPLALLMSLVPEE